MNCREKDTGETVLHAALSSHRAAQHYVVKVLLDAGADPNIATKPSAESGAFMRDLRTRGETPLHRAAAFATEDTIQLLLDAGAKIGAKDMNGDSPLSWASWHLRPDSILRKLLYDGFSIHPARRTMDGYLLGTPLKSRSSSPLSLSVDETSWPKRAPFLRKIRVSERFSRDVSLRMPKPHHTADAPRCLHRQTPFVPVSSLRLPTAHHPRLHCRVLESKYAQRSIFC